MTPWDAGAKWKADAKMGFLGRRPPDREGLPPQPLHEGVHVNLELALRVSRPALEVWRAHQATGAPLYSGGVFDAWPAWVVDVLKLAATEVESIRAFLTWEAVKGGGHG